MLIRNILSIVFCPYISPWLQKPGDRPAYTNFKPIDVIHIDVMMSFVHPLFYFRKFPKWSDPKNSDILAWLNDPIQVVTYPQSSINIHFLLNGTSAVPTSSHLRTVALYYSKEKKSFDVDLVMIRYISKHIYPIDDK